ncbi:hypothetical protein Droror1_Dr00025070 [Drosera rotundifolia]
MVQRNRKKRQGTGKFLTHPPPVEEQLLKLKYLAFLLGPMENPELYLEQLHARHKELIEKVEQRKRLKTNRNGYSSNGNGYSSNRNGAFTWIMMIWLDIIECYSRFSFLDICSH